MPAAGKPPILRSLLPPGDEATIEEIVEGLGLRDRARERTQRPYVLLNMVSTADGRASIGGRSGPIGNRADRELFHALRASVDAVMAGAGTVRASATAGSSRRVEQAPAGASAASARSRSPASSPGACRCRPTSRCSPSRRPAW